MKKIFTFLFLALTSCLLAQNYSVYQVNNSQMINTATLTNGYIMAQGTAASTSTASPSISTFKVKLVNNTASTLTLSVIRRVIYNNPALKLDGAGNLPDSYFCYGFQCFPSNVGSPGSGDYCVLGASGSTVSPYDNSRDNGTPFVIDLAEGLVQGKYFINYTVYNVNNINDSVCFTVKYNEFLSVQENTDVIEAIGNLYPNPSTNNAQLSIVLKQESPVKIQVFNNLGSLVYNGNEQKLSGKNKLSVDCTNFTSGLYFVTVTAGDSKITKRLVINK